MHKLSLQALQALHDIGLSESPACDYVPLLLMHQTDKPTLERGVMGWWRGRQAARTEC